jgi:hypothetical protein
MSRMLLHDRKLCHAKSKPILNCKCTQAPQDFVGSKILPRSSGVTLNSDAGGNKYIPLDMDNYLSQNEGTHSGRLLNWVTSTQLVPVSG